MSESKLIRKARSLGRSTLCRNSTQDSCSMVSTRSWLGLVSISRPSVRGWSASAAKYLMVCGLPSSTTSKSFLVRPGISSPCLSFTLKKMLTTLTCALKVSTDSSSGSCPADRSLGLRRDRGVWRFLVMHGGLGASQTVDDSKSDAITATERTRLNHIPLSFRVYLLYCKRANS